MASRVALSGLLMLPFLALACEDKPESPDTDTTPPVVAISAPAESSVIALPDTIRIEATDDEGVVRVAAYVDGDSLGEDLIAPYAIPLATTNADTLTLVARAWDAAGNRGESAAITALVPELASPDTLAPQVQITQPLDGVTVDDLTVVNIAATDDDSVTAVRVTCDGEIVGDDSLPPFQVVWHPEAWGDGLAHVLVAEAEDPAGNVGDSAPVSVRVYPQTFAAPELLSPRADSVLVDVDDVVFRWHRHDIAPSYQLQMARDPDFDEILVSAVSADTSVAFSIPESGRHYWRVRAGWDGRSWGEWTEPRALQAGLPFAGTDLDLEAPFAASAAAVAPNGGLLLSGTYLERLLLFAIDAAGEVQWACNSFGGDQLLAALGLSPLAEGGWLLHALTPRGHCVGHLGPSGALLSCETLQSLEPVESHLLDLGGEGWAALINQYGPYAQYGSALVVGKPSAHDSPWTFAAVGDAYSDNFSGYWKSYQGSALVASGDSLLIAIGDYSSYTWDDLGETWTRRTWLEALRIADGASAWHRDFDDFEAVDAARARPGGGWIALGRQSESGSGLLIVDSDHVGYAVIPVAAERLKGARLAQLASGDLIEAGYRGDYEPRLLRVALDGTLIWDIPLGAAGDHARPQALLVSGDTITVVSRVIWTDSGLDRLRLQHFDKAGNGVFP